MNYEFESFSSRLPSFVKEMQNMKKMVSRTLYTVLYAQKPFWLKKLHFNSIMS